MNMPQISQQIPQQQQHLTLAPGFITGERSTSRQGSGVVSRQMVRICENSVFFFFNLFVKIIWRQQQETQWYSTPLLCRLQHWRCPFRGHSRILRKHPETMADVAGNWWSQKLGHDQRAECGQHRLVEYPNRFRQRNDLLWQPRPWSNPSLNSEMVHDDPQVYTRQSIKLLERLVDGIVIDLNSSWSV